MYLAGLAECDPNWQDCVDSSGAPMGLPDQPSASGNNDYSAWINLVGKGISTWGQVEMANAASQSQIKTAPYAYRQTALPSGALYRAPVSYPFTAAGQSGGILSGIDTSTMLIIGLLAAAGIYVARS